jgi:hypothetical protein
MQLLCDYHATSDQFIMTNVMLPCGIFQKLLNKSKLLPKNISTIFLRSLIHTRGQIVLCHMATFMIFETFKIKISR